ncbi:fatty acyl-AMP ligase [Mycobacterium sp. M1]|uniref:Fatty acyl-AMP ligase n=1 Tax=Mycolicibacter acidiphilus TaxID=2835306 RepID=A0ABS5RPC5_9MYCO|nr:fatty acyl-AMP ligase [Mycolicibacter acidiphilus]MBS9536150.1 fatty acyl-AMP ligase [Mycolicibacter acidiphilus]
MSANTLMDLLRQQAERYGDKVAFSFCPDGGAEQARLSYAELDARARAVAAELQHRGAAGRRVLLVCEPGLDNAVGLFACAYAGAVVAPTNETLSRLKLIATDIRADFALATAGMQTAVRAELDALTGDHPLQWCTLDAPATDSTAEWTVPDLDPDDTVLIQYTSGSTKAPKGVMVSHRNLLHNLAAIQALWHGDDTDVAVWWLPQHHDMGLIAGILEMVYIGASTVLMAPNAFIKKPLRWLEAMSRHRATITAAPTFAYNLCVKTTTAEQRAALDLSSLAHAWIGTEPVAAATLRNFAEAFAPSGFELSSFRPAFGLAESSLVATGLASPGLPGVRYVDRTALGRDQLVDVAADSADAVALVGCGSPVADQTVLIVDPETRLPCGPDRVGEIWVAGPSVAQGYWGRPAETERVFGARLADTGAGPFLRTGDLGFFCAGELFVTGRWADLVTIRDTNHYPNDIEDTVTGCDPALMPGRCAVFAVKPDAHADEQLVVVQEVQRASLGGDMTGAVDAIRSQVVARHGVSPHDILLVEPMRIPTTTSGKIQRSACRQRFTDGDFTPVARWQAPPAERTGARPQLNLGAVAGALRTALQQSQRS